MPDTFPLAGLGHGRIPETIEGRLGYYCFDMGTPILETTFEAARGSVDIALTGARELLHGEPKGLRAVSPPGPPRGHVRVRRLLLLQQLGDRGPR